MSTKVRDEAAAKAKAEAIAAGKSEVEATAAGELAGLKAENAWYAGEHGKIIGERDGLKAALKDAEPHIARGKKAADDEKDATTKLTEAQAALEAERKSRRADRVDSALRLALLAAGVPEKRLGHLVKLADVSKITDGGDGALVGVDVLVGALKTDVPEFFAQPRKDSGGTHRPGADDGAKTMPRPEFDALSPADKDKFLNGGGLPVD